MPHPRAKTKASGILNDANLWATQAMGDANYPQEFFCV